VLSKNVFVHSIRLQDGQLLRVRPLKPDDAGHLVNLFEHMGPESRFLRFNLSLTDPDPDLVWAEARRMAQIDPDKDGAWLVFADLPGQPEAPVAGARYIRLDDLTAEASVAVRDDMQSKGIGTALLQFLAEQAQMAGIHKLVAYIQRGNRALWRLLRKADLQIDLESDGSHTTITAHLPHG